MDRDLGRFSRGIPLIDHADGLQRAPLRAATGGHSPLSLPGQHLERLPRLPRGVLPVADAFCRFNPIHGQGMSSAAKQARLLQDVLDRAAADADPISALQTGFMTEVASVLETPWTMSTSADLAFPQTRGERPDNFAEAREFEAALFRAAVADPVVHRAMIEVAQLLQPHQRLREPDITRRIEAASVVQAAA